MKRSIALLLLLSLFIFSVACTAAQEPALPSDSSTRTEASGAQPESTEASNSESIGDESTQEPQLPYEITVSYANAYRNALGEVWVQAMLAVTNTSQSTLRLDYSALHVQVSAQDTRELSYVLAFPSQIAPGETGYYYEELPLNYEAEGDLPLTADLNITEIPQEPQRFELSALTITDSPYGGLSLTGTLHDLSAQEGKLVYIAVLLFDENDLPVAVCYTIHTETGAAEDPFELISFMLPEHITTESVARFEAFAYPYSDEATQ